MPAVAEEPEYEPQDSIAVVLDIDSGIGPAALSSADIFLFDSGGTRPLRLHSGFVGAGPHFLPSIPGEIQVVVVANFPYEFNDAALKTMDNLETLTLDFSSDNPDFPVMTGTAESISGDTLSVILRPLMSCIVIESVTNLMGGYQRLEDPYAYLSETNSSAEIFREVGFCVLCPSSDSLKVNLPCDVGIFTQYPSTRLYCYPNDQPDSPSNPATVLNLCGSTAGESREMTFPVPPISRNTTLRCGISFDETASSITWMPPPKIRQSLFSGNKRL